MTGKPDSSGSEGAPDEESDRSEVESWLRKVARVPEEPRIPLPSSGQVIGDKYRIEEQLGKGGMGAVYRATHVVSGKQVALKWMLRPATDERAKQRFTREARAAGRISHPNVVDVYDIGQDGDAGYLVMELLRGDSLRHYLARGQLGPTAVVDLLLPAMRGVAAAHREGVVHRDLKPDNIFLCRAPDTGQREAKVLDFGISSITAPEYDAQTTLTKEGTVLGTPAYMSPEQLHSVRDTDARTDVYAFGIILYEALTGSVPFVGDSYSALVLAIANGKPRTPRELRPEIPVELERVVLRAMDKDRDTRFRSMDALIMALLPFASVKTVGSGEHISLEMQRSTQPPARRSRLLVTLVPLLVLAALAWWLARGSAPLDAGKPRAATAPAKLMLQPAGAVVAQPAPTAAGEQAAPPHAAENRVPAPNEAAKPAAAAAEPVPSTSSPQLPNAAETAAARKAVTPARGPRPRSGTPALPTKDAVWGER
jgi:serine/threonine-protein kinase